MIALYGAGSPNVRKVSIMLEELGLDYEMRYVNIFKGEQFKPEFLALNPLAKVPVLFDPALGRPLYESGAILLYLADRYGAFLPTAGADRYEVLQWLMVQMANVGPMLGQLSHFRGVLKPGTHPYAEARYAQQAETLYQLLDERLQSHTWIAGGAYSIADIAIYPWASYVERHGFPASKYPNLVRWRDIISARPAVARANSRFDAEFVENSIQNILIATDADLDRLFGRSATVPPAEYVRIKKRP